MPAFLNVKKKRHLRKAVYRSGNMLSDREKAGLSAGKKISLPINRDNVILIGIFGTDLGPEVKDMPPYRAGICSCTAAPYCFVELFCRKNLLLRFLAQQENRILLKFSLKGIRHFLPHKSRFHCHHFFNFASMYTDRSSSRISSRSTFIMRLLAFLWLVMYVGSPDLI